jgi:hypothetical protein
LRLQETHLLSLALEEINGRPLYKYFEGYRHAPLQQNKNVKNITKGTRFTCTVGENGEDNILNCKSKSAAEGGMYLEGDFVDFVAELQETVGHLVKDFAVRTEHKRNGQIFRAHPKVWKGVWRDWVEVNWGADGHLPNKLWGFVDLSDLPENSAINFADIDGLPPGVYGIVENAAYAQEENGGKKSEIMVPILKEIGGMANGCVTKLKFYLADVEAFLKPLAVVADIGGPPNAYFMIKSRSEWKEDFEEWLEEPDHDNTFNSSEDDSAEEDYDISTDVARKSEKVRNKKDKEDDEWWENQHEIGLGDEVVLANPPSVTHQRGRGYRLRQRARNR